MGACRENKSVWCRLFGIWKNYGGKGKSRWRGYELFNRRFWTFRQYIWHDSIGKYWNRYVSCPIVGHRNVEDVADLNEPKRLHCFNCEQDVDLD